LGNIQEHAACVLMSLLIFVNTPVFAESCPKPSDPIETDRPDITNSSHVVPAGSLQFENGVNIATPDHAVSVDGTYTRVRLGLAPCLEVLVDLPTYFATLSGPASSGFTDLAPAVKWQIDLVPAKIDLSAVAGISLPTGMERLRPVKTGVFSRRQTCQGKSQEPCSSDGRMAGVSKIPKVLKPIATGSPLGRLRVTGP
jgi:hypothetical protein